MSSSRRNRFVYIFLFSLTFSCKSLKNQNKDKGYLISIEREKPFAMSRPFAMVKIPGGSFTLGQSGENLNDLQEVLAPQKVITIGSFFMDETEITNSQYRKFVFDVRDQIARELLAEKVLELGIEERQEGIGLYAYLKEEPKGEEELSIYDQYLKENQKDTQKEEFSKKINWEIPLIWNREDYPDIHYAEVIESLYLPTYEGQENEKKLDPKKILYPYKWEAPYGDKKTKIELIEIYPDTSCWEKDFPLSNNEFMARDYFEHPAFNNHPVVNVSWRQAAAFAQWRTDYYKRKNKQHKNLALLPSYRLPTEVEWEYAARGGLHLTSYPWENIGLKDERGCFLANFKPSSGNYFEGKKGYLYTSKVKSFPANPYGLYDMAGNVSEWTSSSFEVDSYSKIVSLNPRTGDENIRLNKKKSIRGGSWKDPGYFLKIDLRDWEYEDKSRSYIGFRTVQSIPPSAKTKSSK